MAYEYCKKKIGIGVTLGAVGLHPFVMSLAGNSPARSPNRAEERN